MKLTPASKPVLAFIDRFAKGRPEVVECFTQGCCYWFALVLSARFGGRIMYDQTVGHFGCELDGVVYDITGVAKGKWVGFNDPRTAKARSKTYPGIARAMAEQWAGKCEEVASDVLMRPNGEEDGP